MPGQDRHASGAALAHPEPPLRDALVALWPWRAGDVPDGLMVSAERCGFTRAGALGSHIVFKGARRDTVMFSLLPGELR